MKEFQDYYSKDKYLVGIGFVHPKWGKPAHELIKKQYDGSIQLNKEGRLDKKIVTDNYMEWNRYLWDQSRK